MAPNASRCATVRDLDADDRRSVEHLLGATLDDDQQLYILAFRPGALLDEATRQRGLEGMRKTFSTAEQHARQQGISEAEIDQAVG